MIIGFDSLLIFVCIISLLLILYYNNELSILKTKIDELEECACYSPTAYEESLEQAIEEIKEIVDQF